MESVLEHPGNTFTSFCLPLGPYARKLCLFIFSPAMGTSMTFKMKKVFSCRYQDVLKLDPGKVQSLLEVNPKDL